MIKPKHLNRNDKVAIVAPSMCAKEENINRAIKIIRQMGLNPVAYKSCYLINDKIEVSPIERAKDIMNAFEDNEIKGVISLKAGYGALDILDLLDYECIKNNPKVFVGFSDITGMHLALNKYCDLVTFYGPMATSNIRIKGVNGTNIDSYTKEYFEKALFRAEPIGLIENPIDEQIIVLNEGYSKGKLIGGNLSLIAQTIGTKFEIDVKDRNIFLEDFGESIDSILSMIKKLEKANKFNECAGIIFGTWTKCAEEYPEEERTDILNKKICDVLLKYNKLIISNVRSGHNVPMLTLPLGVEIEIDTNNKLIKCLESATIG